MQIEAIGVLTVIVGLLCLRFGPKFSIYALWLSTLFGASAAAILQFMGGANLQPTHLLLGFVTLDLLLRGRYLTAGLGSLRFPQPGFWLLVTVIYAVGTALFMPRLFAAATNVLAIARANTAELGKIVLIPLGPVSSNITQTIYFVGDLVCFVVFYAYASTNEGVRAFAKAVIACAIAHVIFGMLDFISHLTNTSELMSFMRNGTYSMLNEASLAGFKRIVGSFAEASAYGSVAVFTFAFTGKLWLCGIYPRLTGLVAALSMGAAICSTSTTAYAGLCCLIVIEYGASLLHVLSGRPTTKAIWTLIGVGPVFAGFLVTAMALHQPTWATIQDVYHVTFVEKMSSESGIERSSWNRQALTNLVDTNGLGVGVGSTRTSSWLLAVPVSLGIFGSITYLTFVLAPLLSRASIDSFSAGVQKAARSGCLASLILCSIGAAFIDLGVPFFMCAAVSLAARTRRIVPAARLPSSNPGDGTISGERQYHLG